MSSISITADPQLLDIPNRARDVVQRRIGTHKKVRSPFLIFVWIAVAMGALAMLEPSPSDMAITLLLLVGFFTGNLRWGQELTLPLILLGLFVVANLVSLCYAIDIEKGAAFLGVTMFMVLSWMFVLGVITKYEEKGLQSLMLAFSFGGVSSALIALLCYFNLAPFGEWVLYYDRIKGFFKDPNVFGPYLVIVAVYALHSALRSKALWRKLLWSTSSLIASVGMLLCYSRAAWINYAITLPLFFGLSAIAKRDRRERRRNLIYFAVFAAIIVRATAYAMTIPQVKEVVSYRAEIQTYDADRFATFRAALWLGLSNPLGVGPGQSFLLLDYATHNVYLRVFSENGVIGFMAFTGFVLAPLTRSTVLSQKAAVATQRSLFALVAAALVGTLVNSSTIDTLHWRHLLLLLALGGMPLWRNAHVPKVPSRLSQ